MKKRIKYILRASFIAGWIGFIFLLLLMPNHKFSSNKQMLNVFAWGDVFDPEALQEFEKKTGIKVFLNSYSSNEELIRKLKSNQTASYDIIMPSSYAVSLLAKDGLIKKLDKNRLDFFPHKMNPKLIGHKHDPENEYSIPFQWEVYGFGIDKHHFEKYPFTPTFDLLFSDKYLKSPIAMVNDPIEAISFAAYYLFGPTDHLDQAQIKKVKHLLLKQKKWVEAYVTFRTEYFLATKSCPLAINSSSYIYRVTKDFDFIQFVVPKDYTFITIENFAIPKNTEKDDLIYQFINYFFQDEVLAKQCTFQFMFPASQSAMEKMSLDENKKSTLQSIENTPLYLVQPLIPNKDSQQLWMQIKSSN